MTRDYSIYNKQRPQSSSEEEFVEEDQPKQKATKKQKTERQVGEKRKREVARDDNGDQIFELSSKRRVTVRLFKTGDGSPSVDIREFYKDKASGEMRPGKVGICFPVAQWNKLKELIPDIDEAIDALQKK
ncbi:hypothetical protein RMATCC62417_01543 [Rhizopus microsporus]|nr:hypothetical protein RMATCC62417_01543 [Rhizopus microsporus]